MSRTTGHVDATFYAQVEPEWYGRADSEGDRTLWRTKVTRVTQSRPARPQPGSVIVRLTVRVPTAAFYPLQPEAVVVVPESLTDLTPVEVIAQDPGADQ